MPISAAQVEQLLKPINADRVLKDGKGHSHVSQQDVLAHLIRVFGFGNFDIEVISCELVFETERVKPNTGEATGRWDCCYRAMVRLTVRDTDGREIAHYEDGSTATAQNQSRGDAHDLAYKSAISLSKKRAAVALGDQFGLSLYNRGQLNALVRGTLIRPDGTATNSDVQEGIPQQVTLGNDEVERDLTVPDDDLPRNQDGSVSRSRATDEQLEDAGLMTKSQKKEHGQFERDGEPKPEDVHHGPPVDDPWDTGTTATNVQLVKIVGLFRDAQWHDPEDMLTAAKALVGRGIGNANEMTKTEADQLIDALEVAANSDDPQLHLADMIAAVREQECARS